MKTPAESSAYGGSGWSPRIASLGEEIGIVWGSCGVSSEWAPLKAVLLHPPGPEVESDADPDHRQWLNAIDMARAQKQHNDLVEAYHQAGVQVHTVDPDGLPPPNLMFVADLFFMTGEGAILSRPASTVRAGEERWVARKLADLGVPILRSVRGTGAFEGADALWVDPTTVLLATGLRTNPLGAAQVAGLLREMGVDVVDVGLPYGAMHLMGQLRVVDRDLAIAWPGRVPFRAVEALRARGFRVLMAPDEKEAQGGMALNVVTMGPRRILMAAGNPITQAFFEEAGIVCQTVEIDELVKAAGGIGCLTGVLQRE